MRSESPAPVFASATQSPLPCALEALTLDALESSPLYPGMTALKLNPEPRGLAADLATLNPVGLAAGGPVDVVPLPVAAAAAAAAPAYVTIIESLVERSPMVDGRGMLGLSTTQT